MWIGRKSAGKNISIRETNSQMSQMFVLLEGQSEQENAKNSSGKDSLHDLLGEFYKRK